jgi:dephospho-CoA kinase
MRLIGLTGGIASGKSLVSRQLQRLGATVIDADRIARDVVLPGRPGWEMIVREFGGSFIDSDGGLDRKALGQLVFNDPRALERLNRITHPLILAEVDRLLQIYRSGPEGIVVLDAPLLFETGLDRLVDEVWVVVVDHQTQVKRLMERDRLTEQEAGQRIRLQIPLEEKASRADRVIDNRGSAAETERQVISEVRSMMSEIGKKPEGRLKKSFRGSEEESSGEG